MKVLIVLAVLIVAIPLLALATLLIGLRYRIAPIVDTVRRFNKKVTNRRVLRDAGTAGSPRALIRHVGRRSGRTYDTPVDVIPTDTGYVVALPYGTRADWLRNVLAAGSATVVTDGATVPIDQPALVPTAAVAGHLSPGTRLTLRLFRVDRCLQVRRAPVRESA
ncbi:nitroreductase family deazaflavin-dependent oxidoreductase [Nocardia farcinica]|uniref:Deazaflavin-dependent oxidoreductase, nitroreductase family n=1 Tax=Nocardia farcinica (strain IFM 10152) TaxID=247156 RepID=Q5YVZ5_NOCFA|nr:nitroreductase family deazaflavin-dependent oxidoreductase [Nocardia farcinica]BAD57646.1 hypothetical protein NFA_27990 [Nocardia farcinica IFM 10152]